MLNIPEYKAYGGETKIALMDNSSLAFMHELSQRSYPSDGILSVYDLILIPKWVMEEIEDSTYRSTYVEQLQAQGYPIRWIDETKYGAFVNDEDVNSSNPERTNTLYKTKSQPWSFLRKTRADPFLPYYS